MTTNLQRQAMKIIILLLMLIIANYSFAEIIITPNPADSSSNISIKVVNQYGSAAGITSETISQTGNSFVINQVVGVACSLPEAPTLISLFNVGNLTEGEYSVTVNIQNIGVPSSICPNTTSTQNATFNVATAQVIPVGGLYWKLLLIGFLLLSSLLFIRSKVK